MASYFRGDEKGPITLVKGCDELQRLDVSEKDHVLGASPEEKKNDAVPKKTCFPRGHPRQRNWRKPTRRRRGAPSV